MESCWKADPDDRPEMSEVVERLKEMYAEAEKNDTVKSKNTTAQTQHNTTQPNNTTQLKTKRPPGREEYRGRLHTGTLSGLSMHWRSSIGDSGLVSTRTSTSNHSSP